MGDEADGRKALSILDRAPLYCRSLECTLQGGNPFSGGPVGGSEFYNYDLPSPGNPAGRLTATPSPKRTEGHALQISQVLVNNQLM